ncbi:MAG: hypothetical protein PVI26_02460 [Chitinispirillia bacterium]|jgi:hypothetical protein
MIYNIFITVISALFLIGCGSSIKQFYPDSFFHEDNVYKNKPLQFSLQFKGNWYIETDPNTMDNTAKKFAKSLQDQNAELLFIGSTVEGTQGVRGIAVNLNLPALEYAQNIQEINQRGLTSDSGLTQIDTSNLPIVKWSYESEGFQFIEFFFTLDTYNIRIAFWTKPNIFKRFLPVYFDIISSLDTISKF